MYNVMTPLHLSRKFPSNRFMLFGEALKKYGENKEKGYVSFDVELPNQTDILVFQIDEIPLWKSYVPSNVPEWSNAKFVFRKTREAAEAKLVNPIVAENKDLDVFYVEGGPLVFLKECKDGHKMFSSSLFMQALDLYSRLVRKNLSALARTEHRMARNVVLEL